MTSKNAVGCQILGTIRKVTKITKNREFLILSRIRTQIQGPDPESRNPEIAKKSYVSSGHRTPFQGSGSRITKSRNREMTGDYEPYFLLILLTKMTSHSEGKLDTKPSPMRFSCFYEFIWSVTRCIFTIFYAVQ